ncbi:sigma 54-interacting transcriptional regulator [Ferdinandcohnia sp. Marseille-Q9671]
MKKQIELLIKQKVENIKSQSLSLENAMDTMEIAKELLLDRTAASRYLNSLVKEGVLIKINSRPVYFFHRKSIESLFNCYLEYREFQQFSDLEEALGLVRKTSINAFNKLIGWDKSLFPAVEQCKAAICYPPKGLPVLLLGESGVGKSYLASLVHQHAINQKVIKQISPFITMNCAEYANNPELVTGNLFGYKKGAFTGADKDNIGLIEKADGGVLFLDEAHRLTPECQEKLFLFMDQGIFHRLGDNNQWKIANVRLIFATTENPNEVFLPTLTRRIPIVVEIPSLINRSTEEKYLLITTFYQKESLELGLNVSLHTNVLDFFMNKSYEGNVGTLKNIIRYSCAKAYSENLEQGRNKKLQITLKHLPSNEVHNYMNNALKGENYRHYIDHFIPINIDNTLHPDPHTEKFKTDLEMLYNHLISKFNDSMKENNLYYIDRVGHFVNHFMDKIIFASTNQTKRIEFIVIHQFLKQLVSLHKENNNSSEIWSRMNGNTIIALTHFIFYCSNQRVFYGMSESQLLVNYLQEKFQTEWEIIDILAKELSKTFNFHFSPLDKCILVIFICDLRGQLIVENIQCLILAHGFSTASSIANVANRILKKQMFKPFDMPLQVEPDEIGKQLNSYLKNVDISKGIIIFVDMGSLVDIYKHLDSLQHSTVAVVNNITTQLAIDAGEKILKGISINNIVEEITHVHKPQYKIFYPKVKERPKAIIATCVTGIGTARKIKDLLEKSFKGKDIHIIACDYSSLKNNQEKEAVFHDFNVICIVGTANPEIDTISFIALEDIISGYKEDQLTNLLIPFIDEESIKKINNNMIKYFSLQSVLNHLTILNANQLMEHLSDALDDLQEALQIVFTNATRISMYIHLCCLVERLVTQRPIDSYPNIIYFENEQHNFINIVKTSFSSIEKNYSITIPIAEIGYIYDMVMMKGLNKRVIF